MENNRFVYTLKSDLAAVKPAVGKIMGFIETGIPGLSESQAFELKLVFSELLFNSVIHGNRLDLKRNVDIAIELDCNVVSASVSDEGEGYDYTQLILKNASMENLMEENGRGLKLVTVLTDQIEFNPKGSQIKFCKRVLCDG
ncbi:MAG: ATP-binding protein [Clostridiales bacterium]|jgi:serine/threonine-protein kinase RsbW|nr:ATP-binding protein [Clostridiales bacterium]